MKKPPKKLKKFDQEANINDLRQIRGILVQIEVFWLPDYHLSTNVQDQIAADYQGMYIFAPFFDIFQEHVRRIDMKSSL